MQPTHEQSNPTASSPSHAQSISRPGSAQGSGRHGLEHDVDLLEEGPRLTTLLKSDKDTTTPATRPATGASTVDTNARTLRNESEAATTRNSVDNANRNGDNYNGCSASVGGGNTCSGANGDGNGNSGGGGNGRGTGTDAGAYTGHEPSLKSLEAGLATTNAASEEKEREGAGEEDRDVIVVDWDGPDDPENPKNWTYRHKWIVTLVVSMFTFISPVSSSMVAPASSQIAKEFGITNTPELELVTSVFVLAYAFGPLLLGPLSELFGRSRVLQLANLFYLAFNLGCGAARNKGQLIAFRFLAGLGGSAPLAVGGAVLGDCWAAEERGRAAALYTLAPLLGPVIGPICGSWVAEKSTWRWVFWSTSIVDGAVQCLGLIYLRETFAPLLLERRARKIRKSLGLSKESGQRVITVYDRAHRRGWRSIFGNAIARPFILFAYEPIIQLLGTYMAFVYGLIYLILTTIPGIFTGVYHESLGIAGLHYISLGVGLWVTSQINARLLDKIYAYLKKSRGGEGKPEYRLPCLFPGSFILPIGLFLAGWSAQKHVFWLVPDIGIAFIGSGMILIFQGVQLYVIDAYTLHAASGLAAVSFLRSLAGFAFPLFAPAMYSKLGYGKGDSILGAAALAIGCPAPFVFWFYGERIRKWSRHAT